MQSVSKLEQLIASFYTSLKSNRILVGFSGGLDSTVLLHLLTKFQPKNIELVAVHVHHGLQAVADDWVVHCENICAELEVPLIVERVKVDTGASLEQQARNARYQAYLKHLQPGDTVCVAHHQRDQAETFLLNLLRGAGIKGLAAMPLVRNFGSDNLSELQGFLARPLLHAAYEDLVAYARAQNLRWIEDPTNQQDIYKRNFVRNQVLPLLNQIWLQPVAKIAQAASNLAEADGLLAEIADQDLAQIPHSAKHICLQSLAGISQARQKNLLNFWAKKHLNLSLNSSALTWILTEAMTANSDTKVEFALGNGFLRVFREQLVFVLSEELDRAEFEIEVDLNDLKHSQTELEKHGLKLEMKSFYCSRQLINKDLIVGGKLIIRNLKPTDPINRKSLKKWFQAQNIPPWQRKNWPVVEVDSELVQIVGYRVLPKFLATEENCKQKPAVFIGFN